MNISLSFIVSGYLEFLFAFFAHIFTLTVIRFDNRQRLRFNMTVVLFCGLCLKNSKPT